MSAKRVISYSQAINEAMAEEMTRDERVFLMGQDVGAFGGVFGVTAGLHDKFGPERVIDTPISEMFLVGGGVGAAITGMRPIVELQFADFIWNAGDEIIGKMSKWRYMHGGLFDVPMVLRLPEGAVGGAGPEHSTCPEAALLSATGTYIVVPSTPYDAKGLLKSAIRDDNPVAFFEHKGLYTTKGEVPEEEYTIPLGQADIKRVGSDVTIIAWGRLVHHALAAAELAARDGIDVEVLDPRGLRPLDVDAIVTTVEKTGRVIISHEAGQTGGASAEVAAIIAENCITSLEAPIRRVCGVDTPVPQSVHLEQFLIPTAEELHVAIKEIAAY
ncbi:TPP-dependent acetoin dehydrogenase complex, E1 protein subunit beta [Amycolatopsis deserti]|uniref:TPP-dependent acetoin dehydrogenase complex, E1 protein subunit beta n=1 Tax=Amycolatopsis deserti TaxID=185696 RepID=A0ABQ3IH73_9PSEU|nr:alpha-ketoacid dehydrogenase subunit beta [Amycolatopsis deserti]GHE84340.1 TPP-dependent acetoin dehydrogenase complex, E1 protein subunit beta [Amycolatopsis deserti]